MTRPPNRLRGEIDLTLDGTRFVLRPSHEALLAIETKTGKTVLALMNACSDSDIGLLDAAVTVTELIQAWGRETDDPVAKNVSVERIGELIMEAGLMAVTMRLVMTLGLALTGGCTKDGRPKEEPDDDEGEATPPGESQTPGGGTLASQRRRSGGPQPSSGRRPRTSSGARGKSGKK
jgi:hypothetical protein